MNINYQLFLHDIGSMALGRAFWGRNRKARRKLARVMPQPQRVRDTLTYRISRVRVPAVVAVASFFTSLVLFHTTRILLYETFGHQSLCLLASMSIRQKSFFDQDHRPKVLYQPSLRHPYLTRTRTGKIELAESSQLSRWAPNNNRICNQGGSKIPDQGFNPDKVQTRGIPFRRGNIGQPRAKQGKC